MNKLFTARKLLLGFLPVIILIAVAAIWLLTGRNGAPGPDDAATAVLTNTYGATQKDYEDLGAAIDQCRDSDSDQPLLDYVSTTYPNQFTDNGCNAFILNRIPMRAAQLAHDDSTDFKVTSVTLTPTGAEEGSKQYRYKVLIQSAKDASVTNTFKGILKLVQEDGNWKVDGIN